MQCVANRHIDASRWLTDREIRNLNFWHATCRFALANCEKNAQKKLSGESVVLAYVQCFTTE
eukprot:56907-Rhodomonas_salina.1